MADHLRVLYSFPHKIGAERICYTAWEQVNGLAKAGAEVLLFPGVLHRPVHPSVKVVPTLAIGKLRVSYKLLGTIRACALHDRIVARRLKKLAGQIDIVHTWPVAAVQTLKVAAELGIPTVLERPNAHTRFAYETYRKECEKLGLSMPPDHEYAYKEDVLRKEEEEYDLAYRILCPSDFVVKTFVDKGFARERLVRHVYGYDERRFYPEKDGREANRGLVMISVGVNAVKKGLHYALQAWLKSAARSSGTFLIAGAFVQGYSKLLSREMAHPSVKVLGYRNDVPALMRQSDILILPTIEEGSALVTYEARGSGCVLLVSEAAGAVCKNGENGLVHAVGDIDTLTSQINMLNEDRDLLERLRKSSLATSDEITWRAAGEKLLQAYKNVTQCP
jgi:glycosyltransferase involved in cell wall biosynthesis